MAVKTLNLDPKDHLVVGDTMPGSAAEAAHLKAGDAFRMRSGGGGGHGSPLERPMADVAADAKQGYISLAAVKDQYGVVLDPDTFEVDVVATERRRASMRSAAA